VRKGGGGSKRRSLCNTRGHTLPGSVLAPITEGQLEPLVVPVDVDLESDEGVWAGGRVRGHGGGCSGGCW